MAEKILIPGNGARQVDGGRPAPAVVARLARPPAEGDGFDGPLWCAAEPIRIACWHPRSGSHRPGVRLRLGWTPGLMHFMWEVEDRWVASREIAVNGPVSRDSCVEAFFAPFPGMGYFNLEINAGGTIHLGVGRTAPWADPAVRDRRTVAPALIARHVRVRPSLPAVIDPEIADPCRWLLSVDLELALLAAQLGRPVAAQGRWSGNFYKCADGTSSPHWASWSPLDGVLDFHQPGRFAAIAFAPGS
jgi:hypothetical protein